MSSVSINYESLLRKTRSSAQGEGKLIKFMCILCEEEVEAVGANRCPRCTGVVDAIYDLDQVDILPMGFSPNPLERYYSLLPLKEKNSLKWLGEGNTPCFEVPEIAEMMGVAHLYLKDETVNPTKSTKDRIASVGLSRFGELGTRDLVLASTGNSSTAYARGAQLTEDFTVHIFVGRDFAHRLNYADHPRVITHAVDGEFVKAGEVGQQFAKESGFTWEGGFFNLSRREGLKLAYLEAFDAMPEQPDYVFQAVSSGMGLLGAYKGALEYVELGFLRHLPSFFAVQQKSCAPMARAFAEGAESIASHHIVRNPSGIAAAILRGNPSGAYPYIRDLCLQSGGGILAEPEKDIRDAHTLLKKVAGVRTCFASATALAGALRAARDGLLASDSVVLVNLTGADRAARPAPTQFITWNTGSAE